MMEEREQITQVKQLECESWIVTVYSEDLGQIT